MSCSLKLVEPIVIVGLAPEPLVLAPPSAEHPASASAVAEKLTKNVRRFCIQSAPRSNANIKYSDSVASYAAAAAGRGNSTLEPHPCPPRRGEGRRQSAVSRRRVADDS